MAKECLICKAKVGFFAGQICLKDGSICESCWIKAGGSPAPQLVSKTQKYTSSEIRKRIIDNQYAIVDNSEFRATKEIGIFLFDGVHKIFKICGSLGKETLYQYNWL